MERFTYLLPDEQKFIEALLIKLEHSVHDLLNTEWYYFIEGSICDFTCLDLNSKKQREVSIQFKISLNKYGDYLKRFKDDETEYYVTLEEQALLDECNDIITPSSGLIIVETNLTPNIDSFRIENIHEKNLDIKLQPFLDGIENNTTLGIVKENAIEMVDYYVILYIVENTLRTFIEKVINKSHGDGYIDLLIQNTDMSEGIKKMKLKEEQNNWLQISGASDIHYLTFSQLGKLIEIGWDDFKEFFPSREWITQRILEFSKIRNLVAHNNYVKEDERELLKIYYINLINQIGHHI